MEYYDFTESLEYFFALAVVKEVDMNTRQKILRYLGNLAKILYEMNNFNILNALVKGLNMPAVNRLEKTWGNVKNVKDQLLKYSKILSPLAQKEKEKPWSKYNEELSSIDQKTPVIICLEALLDRLEYDTSPNMPDFNHNPKYLCLNYLKLDCVGETLEIAKRSQSVQYKFTEEPQIQEILASVPFVDHDFLHELSIRAELDSNELKRLEEQEKLLKKDKKLDSKNTGQKLERICWSEKAPASRSGF